LQITIIILQYQWNKRIRKQVILGYTNLGFTFFIIKYNIAYMLQYMHTKNIHIELYTCIQPSTNVHVNTFSFAIHYSIG